MCFYIHSVYIQQFLSRHKTCQKILLKGHERTKFMPWLEVSVAKHKEQFGNKVLMNSGKKHSHWNVLDGRKQGSKEARKEGRKVTQPPVRTCVHYSTVVEHHQTRVAEHRLHRHDTPRSVTHQGLDDRTVMHWWWIIPPWRNGKAHSLPDVVSARDRRLQHVYTSWMSTG